MSLGQIPEFPRVVLGRNNGHLDGKVIQVLVFWTLEGKDGWQEVSLPIKKKLLSSHSDTGL